MAITTQTFKDQYASLNPQQKQAVDSIEGPVIVLAGPGTGKTQILALRVGRILEQTQMDPHNILCLTFTESAAYAMRQRLIKIIGQAAYYVPIHTFHSFCNEIIQEHREYFSFSRDISVLTDVERIQLFQKAIDSLPARSPLKPFGSPYLFLRELMSAVQTLKQENISSERYAELLKNTQQFTKKTKELFSDFFELSPKERSEAACEKFQEKVLKLSTDENITLQLSTFFATYNERLKEEEGSGSTVRTALKNDLKKWFTNLEKKLPYQTDILEIYNFYQQALKDQGRYDYEDMILWVVKRLQEDKELLAESQERWQYMLVDEYQDTNGSQNELLRLLGSGQPNPNIFVVGDDHQSIFRFQGASLENLVQFYSLYKDFVKIITLQSNYRSPQTILDAAHHLISSNRERAETYLPGERNALQAAKAKQEIPITVAALSDEAAEDYWICQRIQELLEQGTDPNEIAVLYRYHSDAERLTEFMHKLKIPFRREGGEDIFTHRRISQLIELLRYIDDPVRDDRLHAVLQYDFWGLTALDSLKVTHYASTKRKDIFSVITSEELLKEAEVDNVKQFLKVAELLAELRQDSHNHSLQNAIAVIITKSGLLPAILKGEDRIAALHHLNRLLDEVKKMNRNNSDYTLHHFLEYLGVLQENNLSLSIEAPAVVTSAVRLMSAHRAKGLEFNHVFVMRLTDGHWGNVRSRTKLPLPPGIVRHSNTTTNEDERRLFYVAMTRAKERLYISYAETSDSGRSQVPSVFLEEVPVQYRGEPSSLALEPATVEQLKVLAVQPVLMPPADVKNWLKHILETHTMSITQLNHYLECPRLFYYQHLLRVPLLKNKHMAFGTAVHEALHDLFAEWQKENRAPEVIWLQKRFEQHLQREVLTKQESSDALALGKETLAAWYQHYQQSLIPHSLLEFNFGSHGVQIDGLRLTGKLDKAEIVDEKRKEVNIVDYKTGNPDNKSAALKVDGEYWRQLVFYKLLCDKSPRFPYKMVSGEIDFIQPSPRSGKYVKKKFEITNGEVEDLIKTIQTSWNEIKDLSFLDKPGCGKCEYCALE